MIDYLDPALAIPAALILWPIAVTGWIRDRKRTMRRHVYIAAIDRVVSRRAAVERLIAASYFDGDESFNRLLRDRSRRHERTEVALRYRATREGHRL